MSDFKKTYRACFDEIKPDKALKNKILNLSKKKSNIISFKHYSGFVAAAAAVIAISGLFLFSPYENNKAAKTQLNLAAADKETIQKSDTKVPNEEKIESYGEKDYSENEKSEEVVENNGLIKKIPIENKSEKNIKSEKKNESKKLSDKILAKTESEAESQNEKINDTKENMVKAEFAEDEIMIQSADNAKTTDEKSESDAPVSFAGGENIVLRGIRKTKNIEPDFGIFETNKKIISAAEYFSITKKSPLTQKLNPVFEEYFVEISEEFEPNNGAVLDFGDFGIFMSTKKFNVYKSGKSLEAEIGKNYFGEDLSFRFEEKDGFYIFLFSETMEKDDFEKLNI